MYKPIQYIDYTKINPRVEYREFISSPSLSRYVACYWTVYSVSKLSHIIHRIIPDGCIDIICNLQEKTSFISGIMDKTEYFPLNGNIFYFGIRFLPNAIPFVLGLNAKDSLNSNIGMDGTFKILNEMTEKLLDEIHITNFINIIDNHLKTFFKNYKINNKFNNLLKHSLETNGSVKVRDMAIYHHMSEKQIGRYFKENIGISTKPFLRILRFQSILKYFLTHKHSDSFQAIDSGFYDQSHLIKDINYFLGGVKNIY